MAGARRGRGRRRPVGAGPGARPYPAAARPVGPLSRDWPGWPILLAFSLGLFIGVTVARVPYLGPALLFAAALGMGLALARLLGRYLARRRALPGREGRAGRGGR